MSNMDVIFKYPYLIEQTVTFLRVSSSQCDTSAGRELKEAVYG
jgi:hypothetical protein